MEDKELQSESLDFVFNFKTDRVLSSLPIIDFEVKEEAHFVFEFLIDDEGSVRDINFNWKKSTELTSLYFELEVFLKNVKFQPLYLSYEYLPDPILNYYQADDYLTDLKEELTQAQLTFISH